MKNHDTVSPQDLLFDQLRDAYSVEDQLCDALPRLVVLASDAALRAAILEHTSETTGHFSELLCIFDRHGISPGNDTSLAMAALIKGGESHLQRACSEATRDLMMIAHCLRIAHYEIAAYEITLRLASRLGFMIEVGILSELLSEEKRMAARLCGMEPAIFELAAKADENVH